MDEIIYGIIIAVLFLVIGLSVLLSFSGKKKKTPEEEQEEIEQAGKEGEVLVAKALYEYAVANNGYLFNDYCFISGDKYSVEIDHILIIKGGFFVIETKSNKGTINGTKDDVKWMCIKKEYQDDKLLENPIKQNSWHIYHLKKMLGKNAPYMISLIIFPYADVSKINEKNVYGLEDALEYIKEQNMEVRYSQAFVDKMRDQLVSINNKFGISKEQHISNIKNKHNI